MNKMFYTVLVDERNTARVESLLNSFRISLNDWGKTKAIENYGIKYVPYVILCTKENYDSIMNCLYEG